MGGNSIRNVDDIYAFRPHLFIKYGKATGLGLGSEVPIINQNMCTLLKTHDGNDTQIMIMDSIVIAVFICAYWWPLHHMLRRVKSFTEQPPFDLETQYLSLRNGAQHFG